MKKNVWILNHYAGGMFAEKGGRHYSLAKYLKKSGYEPTVFCSNFRHNSNGEFFFETDSYCEHTAEEINVPFVFVKTRSYKGNGKNRILNMVDFYRGVKKAGKDYAENHGKPDVIIASSVHPLTLVAGLKLAKCFKVKCICEVRDLWPESLVVHGVAKPNNPLVAILRMLEKHIYIKADALIFTMAGAYEYIKDRGWQKKVPISKVHFINNGVDLETFDYNKENYTVQDADLDDETTFKVVYTGSLRHANSQICNLFEAASLMQGEKYADCRFYVYGKGDLVPKLEKLCSDGNHENIVLKGFVNKKYIPYILSKCDLNILNCRDNAILKYGGSQNKLFDYLASGHPVISGESGNYSVIKNENCGISRAFSSPQEIVEAIEEIKNNYDKYGNVRFAAEKYSYEALSNKLIEVIEE